MQPRKVMYTQVNTNLKRFGTAIAVVQHETLGAVAVVVDRDDNLWRMIAISGDIKDAEGQQ